MSQVGAGAGSGGGAGGGGRDDRLKKKIDDTPLGVPDSDNEQVLPEGVDVDEASANPGDASGSASSGTVYRGVRRYAAGDGSYRTTYVSCINTRDSPHNNRQIWLGRYYDPRAAAIAYDVFSFFNHHDTYVNFPELLHLYMQFVPRRGIAPDGTFLPITASDLERIKHTGLGIIRAFYPDACAAIHTRRNQKALPVAGLTPQERQNAAALQAAYHARIEEQTRNNVRAFITNQPPLAQQVLLASQASPSSTQEAENVAPRSLPLRAANLDFSSIQIPHVLSSQTPRAPTHIDFSAIQVPQYHASNIPLAGTSGPRVGDVRHASTSPDRLRETSYQRTQSSNTPSLAYDSFLAQSPFAQFPSPSQITPSEEALYAPNFRQRGSVPQFAPTQTGHVSRPAAMRARPNPLIRSNIERGTNEEGLAKEVPFEEDPYNKAAEARLDAERMRAQRLNNEAAAMQPGASSFPLVQRLRELSKAPYDHLYGAQQQADHLHTYQRLQDTSAASRASPMRQRWSAPALLGAQADPLRSLRGPRPESLISRSAFSSYKARDNVQGGRSGNISSVPDVIPLWGRNPDDYAQLEEEQRLVPLRRQTPQELPLFDIYDKQASATGQMATNAARGPYTSLILQGPSTSNVQASSATSSDVGLSQHERTTSTRPLPTEPTLARGEFGPPFVRAPLLPDLNERAPEAGTEALKVVSTTTSAQHAPVNIRELQRVSTLGTPWPGEGTSIQQGAEEERSSPAPHHIIEPDKSKQEADNVKGKEKAEG